LGVTKGDQRLGLTILEYTPDILEGGLAIETGVTDVLLEACLDESFLLVSQPFDGLREVSNEPPHRNANETGEGTLYNVRISTAQLFSEEGNTE
jgi:hypothetical protein